MIDSSEDTQISEGLCYTNTAIRKRYIGLHTTFVNTRLVIWRDGFL